MYAQYVQGRLYARIFYLDLIITDQDIGHTMYGFNSRHIVAITARDLQHLILSGCEFIPNYGLGVELPYSVTRAVHYWMRQVPWEECRMKWCTVGTSIGVELGSALDEWIY
jgi:hypothetical protein